ncbi:MAG: hypothetical protein QW103_00495 [Candidatus Pacearchaeota archaeon]
MKTDINFVKRENSLFFKKIKSKEEIIENDIYEGYFIEEKEDQIRRIINFFKSKNIKKKIALFSKNIEEIRRFIETLNFDYLVSPELNEGKDNLRQRSSGLNEYLARLCSKKKINILIALSFLEEKKDSTEKAKIITRIIQNIKICRKKNCEIKIASFSDKNFFEKKERERIGFSLGMSSQQVSRCCVF